MGKPAIVGIPFDAQSSYKRGAAQAPPLIREAFHCDSSNKWTETGVDLGASDVLHFADDLRFSSDQNAFAEIETGIAALLAKDFIPLSLGGDHSITYPIMKAVAARHPGLTVVHFDAHPDLYDQLGGNRLSHACPFARVMEDKLVSRLIQIGIRTLNGHQREQAEKFGVEQFDMWQLPAFDVLRIDGPVYISFDLDVLDPAFVPGVSHHEPGGMSTREAIAHLHRISGEVVGADIVEYNPACDLNGVTARVAAKLMKEICGLIIGFE